MWLNIMVVICLSRCMYCFCAPYNLRFHSLTVNGKIILVLFLSYRSFLRVNIQYLKCKAFFQQKVVKALKSCTLRSKYSFLPEKTLTNSSYPVQTYHHSLQGGKWADNWRWRGEIMFLSLLHISGINPHPWYKYNI